MKNNVLKLSALSIATSLTLALSGCGGGDSDSKPTAPEPVEATGQFIDATVGNLDVYQNDKKIDTTDSEGKFTYMTGSEVTFKLGKLILGSTMPKAIVTPADLSASIDNVVEILQALQSLDEDNDPSNGIFIPQTTIDKLVTAKDLSKDDVSIIDTLKKDMPDLVLVGIDDALAHFSMAQETVKTSTDLSYIANKFVGYWQQSCENGNQQVIQLAKDSVSPNVLYQTGQYVNRKYDNADCTGSYNDTIEYSDTDPLTLTIMGTAVNKNGQQVVNALRTEGTAKILASLVMATADSFSGGELTFSRNDSLAIKDTKVDSKAEILQGYWKSECIESTNGSKIYFLNIVLQGDGTVLIKNSLREDFTSSNCTGASVISVNDESNGMTIPQSDIAGMTINGNNQFLGGDHTVETYNRITQGEFAAVDENLDINSVEQAVDTLVGYWKGECASKSNHSSYHYFKAEKQSATEVNMLSVYENFYNSADCTGESEIFAEVAEVIDLSSEGIPKFINNDKFRLDGENGYEVYNRSTQSVFNAISIKSTMNNTVPMVTNIHFTPATGSQNANIEMTFNTSMKTRSYFHGSYSPEKTYWKDSNTYVIEFSSYTPGGTITFSGIDDRDGSKGFQNSSGIVMQQDKTFVFPS